MKNRLDFPGMGPTADSALGTGINIFSSKKSRVNFLGIGAKANSAFCSDHTVVTLRFL